MKDAKPMSGKIVGSTQWRLFDGKRVNWGQYAFCAQRIVWDNGWKSVRIAYYRRNTKRDKWRFASQTTVNSTAQIIGAICRDILKKGLGEDEALAVFWIAGRGRDDCDTRKSTK
jgi:hypothetical protein